MISFKKNSMLNTGFFILHAASFVIVFSNPLVNRSALYYDVRENENNKKICSDRWGAAWAAGVSNFAVERPKKPGGGE
jgi:hypothetical protein